MNFKDWAKEKCGTEKCACSREALKDCLVSYYDSKIQTLQKSFKGVYKMAKQYGCEICKSQASVCHSCHLTQSKKIFDSII